MPPAFAAAKSEQTAPQQLSKKMPGPAATALFLYRPLHSLCATVSVLCHMAHSLCNTHACLFFLASSAIRQQQDRAGFVSHACEPKQCKQLRRQVVVCSKLHWHSRP